MSKKVNFGPLEFMHDKYDGLDGKTKVSFKEVESDFHVIADQEGVTLKGSMKEPLSTRDELHGFADLLSKAWSEYQMLTPKIVTTASGH